MPWMLIKGSDFMNSNSMEMVANLESSYNLEAKERFSPIPILGFRGWTRFGGIGELGHKSTN